MSYQPSLLSEGLIAVGAYVWFLAGVESLVGLEVRGTAEALPTYWAFKGPLPTVSHLVCHQVGGLVKRLAACSTLELPVLAVGSEMDSQVGQRYEGFVTIGTTVRVRVGAPMGAPPVVGSKTGQALERVVGFVTSVHGWGFCVD